MSVVAILVVQLTYFRFNCERCKRFCANADYKFIDREIARRPFAFEGRRNSSLKWKLHLFQHVEQFSDGLKVMYSGDVKIVTLNRNLAWSNFTITFKVKMLSQSLILDVGRRLAPILETSCFVLEQEGAWFRTNFFLRLSSVDSCQFLYFCLPFLTAGE